MVCLFISSSLFTFFRRLPPHWLLPTPTYQQLSGRVCMNRSMSTDTHIHRCIHPPTPPFPCYCTPSTYTRMQTMPIHTLIDTACMYGCSFLHSHICPPHTRTLTQTPHTHSHSLPHTHQHCTRCSLTHITYCVSRLYTALHSPFTGICTPCTHPSPIHSPPFHPTHTTLEGTSPYTCIV